MTTLKVSTIKMANSTKIKPYEENTFRLVEAFLGGITITNTSSKNIYVKGEFE